jgi:PKD repeat protein
VSMHVVEAFIDPVPSFESNAPLCLGETAVFTNTSVEGVPPTEYYLWDFGDGMSMTTETTETVTHDYAAAGSYMVSLTAHQKQSEVEVVYTDTFEVKPLPLADFSYTAAGLTVEFTNASANATSYMWDFGDGSSSDLENPTHTFDSAGVYTVSLTAYGECGIAYIEKTISLGYTFLPLIFK